MPFFYRVHPFLDSAAPGEAGHPLYVHPGRTVGRIDNPDRYESLYVADTPAGAIAETFASNSTWTPAMFPAPYLPGSVRAVTTFQGDLTIRNLNDAEELIGVGQPKPSRIVTRHRTITQAWSLGIFEAGGSDGVSWWSYHDPDWASIGLWNYDSLEIVSTVPLHGAYGPLREACRMLGKVWLDDAGLA